MSFEPPAERIAREWAEVNALKIRLRKIVDEAGNRRAVVISSASGVPTHTATRGTLYLNTAGPTVYVNNNGTTGWTALN